MRTATLIDFDNEVELNTDDQRRTTIDAVETHLKPGLELAAEGVKLCIKVKGNGNEIKFEPVLEIPFDQLPEPS